MKLISSREAVAFLSQAAPRPWIHRLLRWMSFDQEISAYSTSGKVQAHSTVFEFTAQLYEKAGEFSGEKMDAEIRREYSPEFAELLVDKGQHDRVDEEPVTWGEAEGARVIDPGFFLFADEIDWMEGTITCDWLNPVGELSEIIFPSDDLFGSEFERPEFEAKIFGLSFQTNEIELLLPSMNLDRDIGFSAGQNERRRPVGRPRKWDWEGAMAHVISKAQHPDGLPTGHGAQAKIESLISEWFMQEVQEAPSPSQVRQRAGKIMQMIETPEKH